VSARLSHLARLVRELHDELRAEPAAALQVVHDTLAAVDEDLRAAASYQRMAQRPEFVGVAAGRVSACRGTATRWDG
jgi:hypothetical protein